MDASCFFEPLCTYLRDHLSRGHLPLWNSQVYCGMAQVAVSSPGALYLPNLIFVIAPFSVALAISLIFHQAMAGLGAYLLIAALGWGIVPAVVAGSGFALCGYMFSQYYNFTLMATAAWLPLCLWSLLRIGADLTARNVCSISICAISFCLLITAGRPEIWLPGLCLSGLVALLSAAMPKSRADVVRTNSGDAVGQDRIDDGIQPEVPDDSIQDDGRGDAMHRPLANNRDAPGEASLLSRQTRQLCWRMLAIVCGIALSMPSTLPSMEWASLSPREGGLAWIEVLGYSATWYDFLSLILNRPLGDVEAFGSRYAALVVAPLEQFPLASSVFVGPVVLTLAMWALFEVGWSLRWFYLAGLIGFSTLAAGKNAFFASWIMEHCPVFIPLRYPAKLLIFPIVFLLILAARGAFTCMKGERQLLPQIVVAAIWLLVLAVSSACAVQAQFILDSPLLPVRAQAGSLSGEAFSLIGQAGEVAAIVGLCTALLRLLSDQKLIGKKTLSAFLVGVPVCMSVAAGSGTLSHGASPNFYRTTGPVREAVLKCFAGERQNQFRYMPFMYFPLTPPSAVPGADWTEKYYQYKRQILMPNQILDTPVPCSVGYETAWTIDHKRLMDAVGHEFVRIGKSDWDICKISDAAGSLTSSAKSFDRPCYFDKGAHQWPFVRFCKLTATKYVLTPQIRTANDSVYLLKVLAPDHFELLAQYPEANARLYRVKDALPRAYFAANWRSLAADDEFTKLLLSKEYEDFDPAITTYIDQADSDKLARRYPRSSALAGSGNQIIESSQYLDEEVTLTVRTTSTSLLVLADTYYPGWSITVDGESADLYRANLMNRAVVVPSGTHVVRFQYRPDCLARGFGLAAITAATLLALFGFSVWSGRRQPGKGKG